MSDQCEDLRVKTLIEIAEYRPFVKVNGICYKDANAMIDHRWNKEIEISGNYASILHHLIHVEELHAKQLNGYPIFNFEGSIEPWARQYTA